MDVNKSRAGCLVGTICAAVAAVETARLKPTTIAMSKIAPTHGRESLRFWRPHSIDVTEIALR